MELIQIWAIIGLIATAIPISRIFHRAGFSWTWGVLCLLPVFGWILAWALLALRSWPGRRA